MRERPIGTRRRWFAVAVVALLVATGRAADAQTAPPNGRADSILEARTTELASQLRCPVCQGESIQDSPSSLAQEMRAVVKDQLAAGRTPEEIKAYFVDRYGEWILLQPKVEGLNVILYALPALVLIGGAVGLGLAVHRWTRSPRTDDGASATETGFIPS